MKKSATEDDDDDDNNTAATEVMLSIRRKLERLENAFCSSNLGPSKGGYYSRYELRRIWPYSDREISFEKTTSLFAESAPDDQNDFDDQTTTTRKVDVEKLMKNVEKYFLEKESCTPPTRALESTVMCTQRDVFDAEEMASAALVRRKDVEQQRVARTLRVELNKTRKEKNKVLEDMSNATEKNRERVKQARDAAGTATKKATEMEEERDRYRYRCEKLEIEIRMLRNGERFELLREKMIVREKRLKEKLEDALHMVEVLKLECIEKDAELIRNRERRKIR